MAASGKKNPFLAGFLAGLLTGLVLAVGVALLVTRNNPFVQGDAEPGTNKPSQGATSSFPIEAPKYEFYKALPEGQPDNAAATPAPSAPAYYLQAGAYGNAADADQLKAKLALLGFEVKVLIANEGDSMLHKIRLGPYKSLDELNAARARLTQNGIETILVKTSPEEKP